MKTETSIAIVMLCVDPADCANSHFASVRHDTRKGPIVADKRPLLASERLEELLAGLLKRQEEHTERLKGRVVELRKQAADAEAKLTRLY